jgi:tyrosine aminotransferase
VAKFMSVPAAPLTAEDVILCSGGSGALEMALTALVGEGDNVLVPRPGFPLYQVVFACLFLYCWTWLWVFCLLPSESIVCSVVFR